MIHYLWYIESTLLLVRWNGKKRTLRAVIRPEGLGQARWTPVRKYTLIDQVQIISRLTVVSRAAKQSRTSDTTVCYIHERSILIERSLKACYKNSPYEKTTRYKNNFLSLVVLDYC